MDITITVGIEGIDPLTATIDLDDQEILDAFVSKFPPAPIIGEHGLIQPPVDVDPMQHTANCLKKHIAETWGRAHNDPLIAAIQAQTSTMLMQKLPGPLGGPKQIGPIE